MKVVEQAKDAATVKRVFGEPVQQGDVVVIPVARIVQGGGGGDGRGKGRAARAGAAAAASALAPRPRASTC